MATKVYLLYESAAEGDVLVEVYAEEHVAAKDCVGLNKNYGSTWIIYYVEEREVRGT